MLAVLRVEVVKILNFIVALLLSEVPHWIEHIDTRIVLVKLIVERVLVSVTARTEVTLVPNLDISRLACLLIVPLTEAVGYTLNVSPAFLIHIGPIVEV